MTKTRSLRGALMLSLVMCVLSASPTNANGAKAVRRFVVEDYATKGDTDSARINKALAAAAAVPGSEVYFSNPVYNVTEPMNAQSVSVVGRGRTFLRMQGNSALNLTGAEADAQGFIFEYEGTSTGNAINTSSQASTISNCSFVQSDSTHGIDASKSFSICIQITGGASIVSGNTFEYPLFGLPTAIVVANSLNTTITRNNFVGQIPASQYILTPIIAATSFPIGVLAVGDARNVYVSSNTFSKVALCVALIGQSTSINQALVLANNFDNSLLPLYSKEFGNVTFQTNQVQQTYGLTSLNDHNLTVSGNTFTNFLKPGYGISASHLSGLFTAYANTISGGDIQATADSNVSITRNDISNSQLEPGIAVDNCSNGTVSDNKVVQCAVGIESSNSNNVDISGNKVNDSTSNAISATKIKNKLVISNNTVNGMKLQTQSANQSVIQVGNSADGASVSVVNNQYNQESGKFPALFINMPSGSGTVSGNRTNTLVPNLLKD